MVTLPARAQRAFLPCPDGSCLHRCACFGALSLPVLRLMISGTVPMMVATSSAPVDARTLFTAADGSWKPNTMQISAGRIPGNLRLGSNPHG